DDSYSESKRVGGSPGSRPGPTRNSKIANRIYPPGKCGGAPLNLVKTPTSAPVYLRLSKAQASALRSNKVEAQVQRLVEVNDALSEAQVPFRHQPANVAIAFQLGYASPDKRGAGDSTHWRRAQALEPPRRAIVVHHAHDDRLRRDLFLHQH